MIETQKEEVIIKVSVCVVTFNQKDYIRQCLDSLIDQKTSFRFEIIVGDDASTDGTSEIVEEYGIRYPDLVVPVLHKRNLGPVANMVALYRMARGGYIAHMDGDDMALPGKLERQAHILDQFPGCSMCTHDVRVVDEKSRVLRASFRHIDSGCKTVADLYERLPFFAHSSKMFRNDVQGESFGWAVESTIDIEVHVKQAKKGCIFHLDERLGAYREGVGMAVSSGKVNSLIVEAARRIYEEALSEGCSYLDSRRLKKYYAKTIFKYAYMSALFGRREDCKEYAVESLGIYRFSFLQFLVLVIALVPGATYLPRLVYWFRSFFRG